MHEYTECYLYYSMMQDESEEYIKDIWADHFEMEVAHLKLASELLKKYENKEAEKVVGCEEFPKLLKFGGNIEYIRNILETVGYTSVKEEYVPARSLPEDHRFFMHLKQINGSAKQVPSHLVIEEFIKQYGKDYRFEVAPHPIKELQDRTKDNVTAGTK